jgi:hypothetical protein
LIGLIMFGEDYKSWSSSLFSFLQSPTISSLFRPKILRSTLFSNTLSLCSSINVRDQVSYPYRATGQTLVLNILIFYVYVMWVPCHHGMVRHQVGDGGTGLQIWRVAANILNKQSRTADKGWSGLGVGRGANNSL